MTDSNPNPLIDFEYLLQQGRLDAIYENFIYGCDQHSGTFSDDMKQEYSFMEQDEYGDFNCVRVSFKQQLKPVLDTAYMFAITELDKKIELINTQEERIAYIIMIIDKLLYLKDIIKTIKTHGESLSVNDYLWYVLKYLGNKYPSQIEHKRALKLLNDTPDIIQEGGYFGLESPNGLTDNEFLNKLIIILVELNFLSDVNTDQENFKKVMRSDAPEKLMVTIKINCRVKNAAYIFDKLKQYWKRFDLKRLIDLQIFTNKTGAPLNIGSLYSSLSQMKEGNGDSVTEKIDMKFNTLTKSFKKVKV